MFDERLFFVSSSDMDFRTLVEFDVIPPIAFRDRAALNEWSRSYDLLQEPLGRRNHQRDVVMISGKITPYGFRDGLFYRQIWVSINYAHYRKAVKYAVRRSEGASSAFATYDADHAVARSRLKDAWPEAWINLVLVKYHLNRAIGAMIERNIAPIDKEAIQISLDLACVLKMFLWNEKVLRRRDIPDYLQIARKSFIDTSDEKADLYNTMMSWNAGSFFDDLYDEIHQMMKSNPP